MNTAAIMDIAWEGAQIAFRLIMAARSRRDAEAIVHQLRALGPAERADVDAIERERRLELAGFEPVDPDDLGTLRRLRQDEPTQSSPVGRFPQPVLDMGERPRIAPDFPGGPLGEGD